jgi:antitoxin ParD1/3/4
MSNVEKISVSLPKEMASLLKNVVATGAYASTSEIMREAVRDWQEKQEERAIVIEKYRKMVKDALESGPLLDYSMDDIIRRGRERFKEFDKKSA